MKFEHVAEKVSALRNDRNFSLFMLGLTGGLSAVGFVTGLGVPAVLTAVAAGVYATSATVRQYKFVQWNTAQNLIEDNASSEDITKALENAAGPAKKVAFVSSLPNLDAPSPRPVRKSAPETVSYDTHVAPSSSRAPKV